VARSDGPLAGRRVLVPRPPHQASALSTRIRAAGGEPIEAATIRTEPGDQDALAAAVADLAAGRFVGLCLTSGNGVRAVADTCAAVGTAPATALASLAFVGAVGQRTAELTRALLGIDADVVPERSTGADLGDVVPAGEGEVLLPRGDLASRDLDLALTRAGYTPVPVVAYRTVTADALPEAVLDDLAAGRIDLLAFTSASTATSFATLVGDRDWSGTVVSIGPITSAACRDAGFVVAEEAEPHDLDGLLAALARAASS
jgi:uroporphyrinogen-III synthase